MSSIDQKRPQVYCVRIQTPDGDEFEVGDFRLKKACRVAIALGGWLAVDEWESASRFIPQGVRKVQRMLERRGIDHPFACVATVLRPLAKGEPVTNNGYEKLLSVRVGSLVPGLVADIRREANEEGWREPATVTGPATADHDDDDRFDDDADGTPTESVEVTYATGGV